jgi:hypothetical protein
VRDQIFKLALKTLGPLDLLEIPLTAGERLIHLGQFGLENGEH